MTNIAEIKKALENFRVLFIEDKSNFVNTDIKFLLKFLSPNMTIIAISDINTICQGSKEKFDFVFLNIKATKVKITIENILQINPLQTIAIVTNIQNFIYLEDEFNGKVMEFVLNENVSLQYLSDMIGNILHTTKGTINYD
jgi:hypothetical protein